MLTVRLPATIEARLVALATATGQSKSHYARQAIVKHIDELEARAVEAAPTKDDPFATFAEWGAAADRRAYHDL